MTEMYFSKTQYECWRSDQVNLERSLKELPSSYLALGKLQDNCGKDMRGVVVKTYIGLRGTEVIFVCSEMS